MELLPESFKMKITLLAGTIKRVGLHSRVSHHLFEGKDSGKRSLRSASLTYTISAMIASAPIYISSATHHWRFPPITLLMVLAMLVGKRETIPANRIMEIPFPMPYSVICSPSHITSAEPEVNVSTITIAAHTLERASATSRPLQTEEEAGLP